MVLISFMLVLFEITKQNDFSLRNKVPPPFVSQRGKKLWDFHDLTEIHSFNRKLVSHFLFIFFLSMTCGLNKMAAQVKENQSAREGKSIKKIPKKSQRNKKKGCS